MKEELIIGIDPGSRATGYGLLATNGNRLRFVDAGVIRMGQGLAFPQRLDKLYCRLKEVIEIHRPTASAVEDVFYSINAKSALRLGHARGTVILAAVHGGLPVYEYTPLEVKKAVVGYGRAEKSQVQHMICVLLNLSKCPPMDAADALAVAVCHAHTSQTHWTNRAGR